MEHKQRLVYLLLQHLQQQSHHLQSLAAGEQDKFVPLTGAVTITLPATGYSTGQSIDFYQASGTGAQFASTNSVVGTPGLKFRTTNSVVTAMKTSSGWLVFGDLSA